MKGAEKKPLGKCAEENGELLPSCKSLLVLPLI